MSQQINLYEERLRPRLELATGRNLAVAVLALVLVMAGWSLWEGAQADRKATAAAALSQEVGSAQEKMKALAQVVAERKVSPELSAEIAQSKAMIAARDEVFGVLDSGVFARTGGFSSFMLGFAQQTRADLWLTGFRIAAGGDDIEIHGRTLDPAYLPDYVQGLNAVPVFQGRRFAALEMRQVTADAPQEDSAALATNALPAASATALPTYVEFELRSEKHDDGDALQRQKGGA